jgi:hypothetical protein
MSIIRAGKLKKRQTMTPKLKLNDDERNALLSSILKYLQVSFGIWRIRRSTQMKRAPNMHAADT